MCLLMLAVRQLGIPNTVCKAIPGADEMPEGGSFVQAWQACAEYIKSTQPIQKCKEWFL